SHTLAAFLATASSTGPSSVGELEITRRISLVAVCCSIASARRFSRSRTLEASFFRNFPATGSLASTLGFVGFALRRIGPSLASHGPLRPRRDRRQARRRHLR